MSLMAEGRQIAWASGTGAATETLAPGDRGAGNAAMDLAAEGVMAVTEPFSFLTRYTVNNYFPRIREVIEGMSPERRMLNAGARLIEIFEEQGVDVDQAIALLSANPDFEGPPTAARKALLDSLGPAQQEYLDLLRKANIKFSDRTAGIQSGIPILYALESTGYPRRLAEQGRDAESVLDPVIQRRHTEAYNQYDMLMASLLDVDTPQALGLFADMRRDKYEVELTRKFTTGFEQYKEAERVAFETGETLDSGRTLHKIFFGEDGSGGILGDVNAQSRVLREAIPQDVDVPASAIESGLLASWNNIQKKMSIRGKAPRVSSGKDLWNLDAVLKDFKDFTAEKPETILTPNPDGKDRVVFTGSNQKDVTQALDQAYSEPPKPVTTKEIVNYLGALDQAKAKAMRDGNKTLLEVLNDLEKGALETLDAVGAASAAMGPRVKARFDNYTQFKKQANAIFSRGLLGEDLPGIGPEMTANILFNQFGNSAVMKMEAMDQACKLLV
jgi:Ni,Fe-hydrogenase III small subunit